MDKKIKVYLCTGCGIGETVDIEKLTKIATDEFKLPVQAHPSLCSAGGMQSMRKDVEQGGINSVVISACSFRVNQDVFRLDSLPIERVNLREQVAWTHPPREEETQMLAEDYLRMGIVKAQKTDSLEPYLNPVERVVLVIGGGITGMTAALEAANTGYDVVLVEKEATLGGWLSQFPKLSPRQPPYHDLEETNVESKIREVQENPRIKVMTSAKIETISGQPGAFVASICQDTGATSVTVGSIIQATGWQPYDATKLGHLGFGQSQNVITNVMMEKLARNGKIVRPSDGKRVGSIAFIQCAGQRDKEHLPYCSRVCCMASLKQARYVREQNPEANIYILYKDMRTPGQYEEFYKKVQQDERTFFTKGEVTGVSKTPGGNLVIDLEHTLLGERINLEVDMVVLATGMVPSTAESILHLQYRQGTDLPSLKYGFPASHFLCFPYETRRTAIYAAGCVREPMDITLSTEDAAGAALKSIQSLELIAKGAALLPRAGDLSYPSFALQRCTQCKRCTEECPFGALDEDKRGVPIPNPNRCRRCGICMGCCPERLVSFRNYSIDQLTSAIKAIHVPEEAEKLRILALCCENDAYAAFDMAAHNRLSYNAAVRIMPLRCLGSMNTVLIADALSKGIDGILLMGCKHGEDYQCHFIHGSELANKRMENVQETLNRLVLESERVKFVQLAITDYIKIPEIINEFVEVLKRVGANPYKGF